MDGDGPLVGPEAFKAVHRVFCAAFPDIHVDVEDVLSARSDARSRAGRVLHHRMEPMCVRGPSKAFEAAAGRGAAQ